MSQNSDRTVDRIRNEELYRAERSNRLDFLCIPNNPTYQSPVVPKDKETQEKFSNYSDPKKFVWVYRWESSEWCILPLTSRDYPSPAPIGEPTK